jgi:FixJ family two-component response regulator
VSTPPTFDPTVFVIDDDEAVSDAIGMLVRASGLKAGIFRSASSFLHQFRPEQPGCLVLDIRMPGMNGLELQDELNARCATLPIVFLTGYGDIPMAVRALKQGAFDFIEKPHDEDRLVDVVRGALRLAADRRTQAGTGDKGIPERLGERLAALSARERDVLALVLDGRSSRAIAQELCISIKTVEFHRGRIHEKLEVGSLAELFQLFLPEGRDVVNGLRYGMEPGTRP